MTLITGILTQPGPHRLAIRSDKAFAIYCSEWIDAFIGFLIAPPFMGSLALSTAKIHAGQNVRSDQESLARFEYIILPHLDAAHNLARFLSRDADAAQDIVQEAFLRAYHGFEKFRGGSAKAWILAIVRNCYHDWRAAKGRHVSLYAPLAEHHDEYFHNGLDEAGCHPADLIIDGETPETVLLQRTEAERIRAILDAMPEPFREILVLRELEDLSYHEIAETAGLPIGTVMSRLARARKIFADLWRSQEKDRP